jgi:hypothetical protein
MTSSDDDATKVIYSKATRPQETVMMPEGGSVAGRMIGVADIPLGQGPGATVPAKDDNKTVFIPANASGANAFQGQLQPFDPVVAWLVITNGPGRGHFRPVFYGQNSLGRAPDMRISVDFGDQRISREAHAYVIYDDVEHKFFVRDNGKSNIVRVNGEMVLQPTELRDRDCVSIGDTTMLFVVLCDSRFDWSISNAPQTA